MVIRNLSLALAMAGLMAGAGREDYPAAAPNRPPLAANAFNPLPLGAVKPLGWLKRQLRVQADGQTGHLDQFWPSLDATSGWLGGTGESWERGPYYLDGLIPLAWQLEDEELKAKARRWVEWTLTHQRADGGIGPAKNTDWWPNFVMLKALAQYQEATGDERVIPLMTKYFAYMAREIEKRPLHDWAIYRAGDQLYTLAWLYNRTGNLELLELARKVAGQGYDWQAHFAGFRFTGKVAKNEAKRHTHVVNNAMALKWPGMLAWFSPGMDARQGLAQMLEALDRYHELPNGLHSGDEHYAGTSPVQGTELCAVVEGMFSLETMLALTGDAALGDRVEKMAFNGLPAAFDDRMWAHQYDQQPNQVLVDIHPRDWTTNGPESNLFGLEPNFGCCTANFHQGWPKFVSHLWMAAADGGVAAALYAPSEARLRVRGGVGVTITEETEYPFRETVRLRIRPEREAEFPLYLRIPAWARGAEVRVNGRRQDGVAAGSFHRVERRWRAGDVVALRLPMEVRVTRWFNESAAVERGPLVFALKVGEKWTRLRERGMTADWAVSPTTPWNYALAAEDGRRMKVRVGEIPAVPFSGAKPAVTVRAPAVRLEGWEVVNGSAAPPPRSPVRAAGRVEWVELIPYGAAKLRVTAFPLAGQGGQ